jgi:transposase InsO family protein
VKANQAIHPVRVMCRLLKISRSGFYAWDGRPMSARAREDIGLTAKIHAIHRRSRGAYGAPMIHAELAAELGVHVGRKRVAGLMRSAARRGVHPARFVRTRQADPIAEHATNLVERQFIVLDVWSRRIVGWMMDPHLRTELVFEALNMALAQRRPDGVIHHSDKGCQYTSYAFGKRCREIGVMQSTGAVGDAYDNAMAESFFATL